MALVGLPFVQTFTFARPAAAAVRNAAGLVVVAAANTPRFDHDAEGRPLGLLVEGGDVMGQADRCRAIAGDWEASGDATVFHEYSGADGVVHRRALYSTQVRATIDALLAGVLHHRRIGAAPGFLRNQGGHVRFRDMEWALPAAIAVAAPLVIGDEAGRVLVDG